jgi:glycosyltransferase involved in cell wall biosynthesis
VRVGILGPVAWRTPPYAYGPWEQVTGLLADGLVEAGVEVTLFATLDSITAARLDGVCARGYADDASADGRVAEAMHVSYALASSGEFDIVHNHLDWLPLAFADHCRAPLVTTVHGFSGPTILPAYRASRSSFVSISDADRHPDLDYVATVHHGVDVGGLPFSQAGAPGLVSFGRIHPDKGTHTAIEIARRAGRKLTLCGIVHDQRYFDERVAPHIDGEHVVFLGVVGPQRRGEILGRAEALLHPIDFDEPFGLSVVESMVCGTPVIAYPRGSMPEIVDDGVTGFLVRGVDQAVAAVGAVDTIDRAGCRDQARKRFDAHRMVADYLAVYEQLIGSSRG